MPRMRHYLRWIARVLRADSAPALDTVVRDARNIGPSSTGRVPQIAAQTSTVVAFTPASRASAKTARDEADGAVVIPLPDRRTAIRPPCDPPALAG